MAQSSKWIYRPPSLRFCIPLFIYFFNIKLYSMIFLSNIFFLRQILFELWFFWKLNSISFFWGGGVQFFYNNPSIKFVPPHFIFIFSMEIDIPKLFCVRQKLTELWFFESWKNTEIFISPQLPVRGKTRSG